MRLSQTFDPLEVGEVDNFAFNFSSDVGTSTMVSTSWTCTMASPPTGTDPNPQSRVLGASVQTTIEVVSGGVLRQVPGNFSVARIGGMPPSAAGTIYILEATANLSDGRILKLNSTVQCVAAGN
jgi:hypothetical protein